MNKTKGQLKNEAKELSLAIKLKKAPLNMIVVFKGKKDDWTPGNVTLEPKDAKTYRADLVKEDKKFRIKQKAERKKIKEAKKLNINSHKGGTKSNDKSKKV